MTVAEIAAQLVENCRKDRTREGLDEIYSPNAESVEAFDPPGGGSRVAHGLEAIRAKHDWWDASFTQHKITIDGPYLHGSDRFAVIFGMDVTEKESGQRMQMQEVAIYTVMEEQIVKEEFYAPAGQG